jgi:hypothetical protein
LAALFYVTIASSLLRWKDFNRSEDDVNALARSLVVLGKFTESLDWLKSTHVSNSNLHLTKGMALLSINRIDQGLDEIKKGILDQKSNELDVYSAALFTSHQYCLPSRVNSKLLDKWLNSEPDESFLFLALLSAELFFSEEILLQLELDSRIRSRPIHHAMLLRSMKRLDEMDKVDPIVQTNICLV